MDLSKLPKLSNTKEQSEQMSAEAPEPVPANPSGESQPKLPPPSALGFAETWLSVGVGLFLLLFYPRFLQWASSRLFHTYFNEFKDDNGVIVAYQTLPEFWSDLGPTLLAIVLILDGLLIFSRRPALILIALALTAVSTAYNLIWVIVSYNKFGPAPISMLAVIFGGFILSTQWAAYQNLNRNRLAK